MIGFERYINSVLWNICMQIKFYYDLSYLSSADFFHKQNK